MNAILKRQMDIKKGLKDKKGFTLVEVIVVLVILAILIAIAVPSVTQYINKSKVRADKTAVKTVQTVLQAQVADYVGDGVKIPASADSEEYGTVSNIPAPSGVTPADEFKDQSGINGASVTAITINNKSRIIGFTYEGKEDTWVFTNGAVNPQ
ncbi:MAG: prepilin-type N-terminal cleavage/methylation domain-containing protein [Clostridiales Family XIII bacterium]|jgi:type IV pilus assembly protein PilA|nr:prepilin-type N-terminal cleavage/methylation domain-containing protein [Clostridiales Family XIII bacterium]